MRKVVQAALLIAACSGIAAAPWQALAQTTRKPPAPATNGIRTAAPPPITNGIKPQAPQGEAGSSALIVPVPAEMTWGEVVKHDSLQFSVIPRGKANVLFVWGGVDSGDSVRFREALEAAKPIEEIWLESPGGSLGEGLEIGRLIHSRKLATHVIRGHHCVSACNFMFMGGVIRYVDSGASFEVHMFSDNEAMKLRHDLVAPPKSYKSLMKKFPTVDLDFLVQLLNDSYPDLEITRNKFKAALDVVQKQNSDEDDDEVSIEAVKKVIQDYNKDRPPSEQVDQEGVITKVVIDEDVKSIQMESAQVAADIARFLTEMGLSLKFLTRFAEIHNDQPTALTRDELREFNVINTD